MKVGRFLKISLILFLTCLCGWIGFILYNQNVHYQETRFLFDTEVSLEVNGWGAKSIGLQALNRMNEIDSKLDKFSKGSELDRINQAAGVKPVEVSDLTFEVIQQSIEVAEMTQGAYDPTIGPIMTLWGFGLEGQHRVPSAQEVEATLKLVDYRKVVLDQEKKTVFLAQKGMVLDLGGIAKGYAVDQAVSILRKNSITSALVSAGGNIFTIGQKSNNSPWQIGIRNPVAKGKVVGYVQMQNQDIDTSGDYEQFFWAEGKKYSHIMDPRTGYPVQGVSGSTVIVSQASQADALATAVFVLGAEKGLKLIDEVNGSGLVINSEGELFFSSKMKEIFKK
ncbi:Thiamin biosynthesis lipoprotein ApbE [Dehalobacter sp. UNSWDHB]|nr:Thiamin biosynthesis lipoprotein ApbE [Dehalobacter sp. UNSWDHB]